MPLLNTLPHDHPLRNTPLGELNAEYRWKKAPEKAAWNSVKYLSKRMQVVTFNMLGEAWLEDDWRVNG